ncbi:hypothetical protein DFP72DRAFT_1117914 [Ephemerocybe angulata]|uniref:Uncharacterized protein n=1 Tax=Ephemerocybe angulata TaxID=980116 RepID=A0A8H6I056_9AGAR|nr:hypothetical protein DFP72DRAFT_1117914 [Tulosesus angulatus]
MPIGLSLQREPTASSLSPSKPSPIATTTTAPPSSNKPRSKSSSNARPSSQKRDSTKPSKRHSKTHRRTGSSTPSLPPHGAQNTSPRARPSPRRPRPHPLPTTTMHPLVPHALTRRAPAAAHQRHQVHHVAAPQPVLEHEEGLRDDCGDCAFVCGRDCGGAVGGGCSAIRRIRKRGDKEAEASSAAEECECEFGAGDGECRQEGYEIGVPVVTAAGRQFAMRGGARPAFAFVPTPAPTATSL